MSTVEQVISLPRTQLRESPFNPRKTYNQASLLQLADTMRAPHGRIHSPLVVRPLEQADIEHTHELVFGHRRFRAAGLADLLDVPVIVRIMTDAEVRVAQLIENAQREDVTPLEEADSLNELRRVHDFSIERLMERTGKGRSYVFASLKLAVASDELRQAVAEGAVGGEVAKLLATLPNPLQVKALAEVTFTSFHEGAVVRQAQSFRNVKRVIDERYRLKLTSAPFDTLSIKLLTGTVACDACTKRSDREPVLLEQCGPDVCTDPDCFAKKSQAHAQLQLAIAKKAGHPVIRGDDAKKLLHHSADMRPTGYTVLEQDSHLKSLAGKTLTFRDLLDNAKDHKKIQGIKLTIIEHPHRPGTTLECLDAKAVDTVLQANGFTVKDAKAAAEDANTSKWQREQRQKAAEARAAFEAMTPEDQAMDSRHGNWPAIKQAIMRRVAATPRSARELRIMLLNELDCCGEFGAAEQILGWSAPKGADVHGREWRTDLVNAMTADQMGTLLVMVAIDRDEWTSLVPDRTAERRRLAEAYGVDILNPDGAAPTPSEAARCAEGAPPEADAEKQDEALAPAAQAHKVPASVVKYRCPNTGSTWSGRGLQPKWLKGAIMDGKRLDDFVVPTPSKAARTPTGGGSVAPAGEQEQEQLGLAGLDVEEGAIQAGFAGKDDGLARDAGGSDANGPQDESTAGLERSIA